MDALAFLAGVINSLAWPMALVVIVLVLRKPLIELLPNLSELKWKDFSLIFNREVAAVKAELSPPQEPTSVSPIDEFQKNHLLQLAEISPRAAVLEAWVALESVALSYLTTSGVIESSEDFRNHGRTSFAVQSAGAFRSSEVKAFNRLQSLRNKAAHAPEFALTTNDAVEYIEVAGRLANIIEHASPN